MSTIIDNLRIDHRVTVLRDFTDANGITLRAGESGLLRELSFDQIRLEMHLGIERDGGKVSLVIPAKAAAGPRLGHMQEYLERGDYVPVPGTVRVRREPPPRTMIVPANEAEAAPARGPDWWKNAQALQQADRLEEAENVIRQAVPHLGFAASIAEMYAQRMRAFQRAGDEPRAAEAFKRAVDWMDNYASYATSGGEGAALSLERDQFHADLVKEFGYDPA